MSATMSKEQLNKTGRLVDKEGKLKESLSLNEDEWVQGKLLAVPLLCVEFLVYGHT